MARILSGGGQSGGHATPPPLGRTRFSGNLIRGFTRFGGRFSRGGVRRMFARDPESGIQSANIQDVPFLHKEVKATLTTAMSGTNNDITFTAKPGKGATGNSIRVRVVVSGASTPLSVSVSSLDITINSATNGSSVATTTAAQAIAAVLASAPAAALVDAALAAGNDGTGVVAAFAYTNLAGGVDPVKKDVISKDDPIHGRASGASVDGGYAQRGVPEVRGKQTVVARNVNRRLRKR